MPAKVLIVEPHDSGHRLDYVRHIAVECAKRGSSPIWLTTSSAARSPRCRSVLGDLWSELAVIETDRPQHLPGIQAVAEQAGAQLVVIPDGDATALRLARGADWSPSIRLVILVMRDVAQPTGRLMVDLARTAIRKALLSVAGFRRGVRIVRLRSSNWPGRSGRRDVRDPVELAMNPLDVGEARARLGIADGERVAAIVGAITERKNVPLVADAIATLPGEPLLLLAGRLSSKVRERLPELPARLLTIDRDLSMVELDSAIIGADVIVLAHDNEGPSGILGRALAAGVPVVAAGARSLRRDVLGAEDAVWVRLDEVELREALNRVLGSDVRRRRVANRRIADGHEFASALLDG